MRLDEDSGALLSSGEAEAAWREAANASAVAAGAGTPAASRVGNGSSAQLMPPAVSTSLHPDLAQLLQQVGAEAAEPPSQQTWQALIGALSRSYREADQKRMALEQSVEAGSREAQQLYDDLKRRTESARVEQEAIMRATLESAVEGILVVDNARRVIAVNKRFAEMARLPDSVMATRDQRVLVTEALKAVKVTAPIMPRVDQLYAADATDATLHEELELRDGSLVDWFSAPVRTPDGTQVGRVAFFRDVTPERRAHRELEHAREAAEAASRAKSLFLANMSHELRTPLNAVIGLADLLLLGRDPLVARQREYLGGIASSGRHLLALVNDVLDLAKIEAGKQDLDLRSVAVHEAIAEGLTAIVPLADVRGVVLEPAAAEEAGLSVRADRVRLRQVFYNLISNAVKFTDRGGSVRVCARRDGEWIAIAVADTGIGIAASDLSRLYRSFEQLTLPSGDRPGGTGLGLALTKRLVEMHGGTIEVESELGVGTTFTVRIPVG